MDPLPTIPVFPLNAHIFPQGRMRLRIFEPRYLRMIREQVSSEPAFAMAMVGDKRIDGEYEVLSQATLVKVVDFDQLDAGLLGITIEGVGFAELSNIVTEEDKLRIANYKLLDTWPSMDSDVRIDKVQTQYHSLLTEYPELAELYPELPANDVNWYIYRWLEVLPFRAEAKYQLITQPSPEPALETLLNVIDGQWG